MASELPMWAQRIRSRREELRLYREEVADRLGLSAKSIQRYEEGKQRPPVDRLEALAAILGTTTAYLLGEAEASGGPSEITADAIVTELLQRQRSLEEGQDKILEQLGDVAERLRRIEERVSRQGWGPADRSSSGHR